MNIVKKIYISKWFSFSIAIIGVILRSARYIYNRSLWLDEASLALNIINKNYLELLKPLEYGQASPPLFLILVKFLTHFFGYGERVLRLIPFLAGIISVFLFWYLSKKFLNKNIVPIALILFAIARYPIYFSSEFKQYSTDLMASLIIVTCGIYLYENNFNLKSSFLFAISGTFLIWLSHTSVFMLSGVLVSLLLIVLIKHRQGSRKEYLKVMAVNVPWLISFLINYFLFVKDTAHQSLYDYWQSGFAPVIINSMEDLLWYPKIIISIINDPLFLYFPGIVTFLFLAGLIHYYKKENKLFFLILVFPIFIISAASFFKLYPIKSRMIFFLLPVFYLLILGGLEKLSVIFDKNKILIVFLVIFLLIQPLGWNMIAPWGKEETRQLIEYYNNEKINGDRICLYYSTERAFLYYTRNSNENYIIIPHSRTNPEAYLTELEKLDGEGRIWFMFSHIYNNEEEIFIQKLDQIGNRLDHINTQGASLYLYSL